MLETVKNTVTKMAAETIPDSVKDPLKNLPGYGEGEGYSDARLQDVVNFALYAAGLISVVMIIIAGVQMTTSAGDPGKVAKAKRTITYAIVGLLVSILAFAIVNFVVGKATSTTTTSTGGSTTTEEVDEGGEG